MFEYVFYFIDAMFHIGTRSSTGQKVTFRNLSGSTRFRICTFRKSHILVKFATPCSIKVCTIANSRNIKGIRFRELEMYESIIFKFKPVVQFFCPYDIFIYLLKIAKYKQLIYFI